MQIKEFFLESELPSIFQLFKQKYKDLEYDFFYKKINEFVKDFGKIITVQQEEKILCVAFISKDEWSFLTDAKIVIQELIIDEKYGYESAKMLIEKIKIESKNKSLVFSCKTIDRNLHSFLSNCGFILAEFTFIFE